MFLSKTGLEIRDIWYSQQRNIYESDVAMRHSERAYSRGQLTPKQLSRIYLRQGQHKKANEIMQNALARNVERKKKELQQRPEQGLEASAVRKALPDLQQSIHDWTRAYHLENLHGPEIERRPHHPQRDKLLRLRRNAKLYMTRASWNARNLPSEQFASHVHDLMKDHEGQVRRQYLAYMHGAVASSNDVPPNPYLQKEPGYETYYIPNTHKKEQFRNLMHQKGHKTFDNEEKVTHLSVKPGGKHA